MAHCNWNTAMAIMMGQLAIDLAEITGTRPDHKRARATAEKLSFPVGWSKHGHFGAVDEKLVAAALKPKKKRRRRK